jgi:replication-associated recombination protein RarA
MSKFAIQHEPISFSDLVFADTDIEKRLGQYACGLRTKSIILHGAYGTGKSTLAKLLVAARDPINTGFWPTINCGVESVDFRQRLSGTWGFSEWLDVEPMCVLEETDLLSKRNQFELRGFMDLHGGMFVLTTNHLHNIDKSLQSRCDVIEILSPPLNRYLPAARRILQQHQVPMDDIRLARLLQSSENWRQTLEALEDVVREYFVRQSA